MIENEFSESRILVVDDDDFSRELIVSVLRRIGCNQVFPAHDADTAQQLAQQHQPDFVLLDIYMPQIDGWALLDQLRRVLPGMVAIMVTGSHTPADFGKSLDRRVDGFCIKPVMPDIMRKTLRSAKLNRAARR